MRVKSLRMGLLVSMLGLVSACGDEITNIIGKDAALLSNTDYVDFNPPVIGSEASNLLIGLERFGVDVDVFTDISAAGFAEATRNARILVIPEQETADLTPDLDAAAEQVIVNFVTRGGTLLVFLTNSGPMGVDLVNSLFGFTLAQTAAAGPYAVNPAGAAGTPFEGGPGSVPANNATETLDETTLPTGASVVYRNATLGDAALAVIPVGSGRIVIVGWDWYDAAPPGAQDGGWQQVLYRATTY